MLTATVKDFNADGTLTLILFVNRIREIVSFELSKK